ncbi:hypothetical protein [Ancylobacter defluvii]|uniref:hypothetical protein n=1 Tax=Ancylobacter defluvii TaxID=1282440 RepID=UPI001BCD8601|nr:hypothetical protein [Ancylobacter defluvii]MBS7587415.1 hypothetical protein [Ancylobacter defluvii]
MPPFLAERSAGGGEAIGTRANPPETPVTLDHRIPQTTDAILTFAAGAAAAAGGVRQPGAHRGVFHFKLTLSNYAGECYVASLPREIFTHFWYAKFCILKNP